MTWEQLCTELDRLQGLAFPPPDYQTHWIGLQDMAAGDLAAAVKRAARACERFPSPAELRTLADAAGPPRVQVEELITTLETPVVIAVPFLAQPIQVTREWRYYCDDCSDTGWVTAWCGPADQCRRTWVQEARCPSTQEDHAPHEWVHQCACWASNPALVKKRTEQCRYAADRQASPGRRQR